MLERLAGKNIVVYDCEIENEIDGTNITWNDHAKMGLSVAALFDYKTGDYEVYLKPDAHRLADRLNSADLVVGFNINGFDHKLVRANGGLLNQDEALNNYDMLEYSRKAVGSGFPKGLRLDDHLKGTFGEAFMKTEDGADAPRLWQRGEHARVISYCISDVRREKTLFEHIVDKGWVYTPTHGKKYLDITKVNQLLS